MVWLAHNKPPLGSLPDFSNPLTRGLVGLWLMNEGGGSVVQDLSGSKHNGALTGLAKFTLGNFGPAVDFAGVTGAGEIAIPFGSQLDGKCLTIVSWINWNQDNDTYPRIVDRQYNGQFSFYIIDSGDIGGSELSWALTTQDQPVYDRGSGGSGTVPQNEWVQCCFTYENITAKTYINGVVGDSYTDAAEISGGLANSTDEIIIGEREDGAGRLFDGQIDHVMIWDRALSASEIAQLYRDPFIMFGQDPIELWVSEAGVSIPVMYHHYQIAGGAA